MDDLTELQSRVAAAQERLQQTAEEERRYGLRLNDIVAIVEGSLARQRHDLEKLQAEVDQLQATVGRMSVERDEAKTALIQAHNALSAAQARLGQREVHNEQLRRMLLELLAAIESHKGSAIPDVMRRLEGGIKNLMQEDQAAAAPEAPEEPTASTAGEAEAAGDAAAEIAQPASGTAPGPAPARAQAGSGGAPARGRILSVVVTPAKVAETSGQLALAAEPERELAEVAEAAVDEEFEDAAEAVGEPEAVADIAMSEAGEIVAEPELADAGVGEAATPASNPQEQELVNALLDAEKRLIEAEALASAANVNSPVAEIIRRISQRTREIAGSGTPQA